MFLALISVNGITKTAGYVSYSDSYTISVKEVAISSNIAGDIASFYLPSLATFNSIKIGDFSCFQGSDSSIFVYFNTFISKNKKIFCTVPNVEASYFNISAVSPYGQVKFPSTSYKYSPKGLYQFQIAPQITEISNNGGSINGQIITIKGKGFSLTGNNIVMVDDSPCRIITQSSDSITCDLDPMTSTTTHKSLHGGLEVNDIWRKIKFSWHEASTPYSLYSFPQNLTFNMTGYFRAPVTGDYMFYLTGASAILRLDNTPICNSSSKGIYKVFSTEEFQMSKKISLVEGQFYPFEVLANPGTIYADPVNVGVSVPYNKKTVSNDYEIQSVRFEFSNPAGKGSFVLPKLSSDKYRINLPGMPTDFYDAAQIMNYITTGITRDLFLNKTSLTSFSITETLTEYQLIVEYDKPTSFGFECHSSNVECPTMTIIRAISPPLQGTFELTEFNYTIDK